MVSLPISGLAHGLNGDYGLRCHPNAVHMLRAAIRAASRHCLAPQERQQPLRCRMLL